MLRSSAIAELAGVRTVSVVCSTFLPQARALAKLEGFARIAIAEYPGHVAMDSDEEFRQKITDHVLPAVIIGLTRPTEDEPNRR